MKILIRLMTTLVLMTSGLVACTQKPETHQSINNPPPPKNVNTDTGQAIGKDYGHGKETTYGQVKKIPSGQVVPPIAVAPVPLMTTR